MPKQLITEVDAAIILLQLAHDLTANEVIAKYNVPIAAATKRPPRKSLVATVVKPSMKRKRKQSLNPKNLKDESTNNLDNFDGYEWTSSPESAASGSGSSDTAPCKRVNNAKEVEYQRQPNGLNASRMSLREKLKVPAKYQ